MPLVLLCLLAAQASPAPLPEALPPGAAVAVEPVPREPVIRRIEVNPQRLDAELAEASRTAAREHARVLVVLGARWCEPCRALDAAFARESNRELLRDWRLVELDVDTLPPGPVLGLALDTVPALVKLGPTGRPAGTLHGRSLPAMEDAPTVDRVLRGFLRP
jgi:thioredoxin-like negative regulator of GroEL